MSEHPVAARLCGIEAEIAALEEQRTAVHDASRSSNADDEHDPEGSTIAFERAQLDAVLGRLRRTADDLRAALERVADGTYGVCAVCGEPIPTARLAVRPQATTCVAHA